MAYLFISTGNSVVNQPLLITEAGVHQCEDKRRRKSSYFGWEKHAHAVSRGQAASAGQ